MSRRWSIAYLLAALLQLASTVAPAADLVICVSADGRAALEFAAPGTVRCGDTECDEVLTDAADHSCRDIPVLSAGDDLATGPAVAPQPAVAATAVALPPPAPIRSAGRAWSAEPEAAARQHRSVVLIL
jgi:hypothetical protein